MSDGFELYDLKVEVVLDGRSPVCRHIEGEFFTVEGENLVFAAGQKGSMDALAAVLPLVGDLLDTQPGIDVSISTEVLAGTWEALLEHRVDLIIGGIGDVPGHKGLQCEPWREIEHLFVAAPDHPVCSQPQPIDLETVRQHRAVIIRDTSRNTAALSRGILNQQTSLYVPTMEAKLAAHRAGLGVGYVPANLAADDIASGKLVALTLAEPRESTSSVLAWRAGNRGQALHFLLDRLRQSDAVV